MALVDTSSPAAAPSRGRPRKRVIIRGRQSDAGLKLSYDRKVSPLGYRQPAGRRPGRMTALVGNSFGLPTGITCPGLTPFCKGCYAVGSEQSAGVRALLEHNLAKLEEAGSVEAMTALIVDMLTLFLADAWAQGVEERDLIFRIHWAGDFFSEDYARAWAAAVRLFPELTFFAYTRSFRDPVNVVPILAGIDNCVLYLSADEWNAFSALRMATAYKVRLAYCAEDYQSARALSSAVGVWPTDRNGDLRSIPCWNCEADAVVQLDVPAHGEAFPVDCCVYLCAHHAGEAYGSGAVLLAEVSPGAAAAAGLAARPVPMVCPENAGRIPLMNDEGRGACVQCRLCPGDKRDILFSSSHREDASVTFVQISRRTDNRCNDPDCNKPLAAGRGRPRKWCSDQCRWVVYRRNAAAKRRQGASRAGVGAG